MLKKTTLFIPALLAATLSGCGMNRQYEIKDANLVEVSYEAVDELKDKLTRTVPKNSLIIVSTLLNVDNLNKTSAFGRIVSDQIASAFHQSGYQIIGMEIPIDLFVMKEDGSLQMSDENKAMLKHYNAGVLVGGVYAPGKRNTYVSLRMVNLNTKSIISSTDFSVPMGPDAKLLTQPKGVGTTQQNTASAEEATATETENGIPKEKPAYTEETTSTEE
ncbi:MAG: FlgO family outer membrane protein [Methylovulum sp.]|nr:FlgO family outer membrane protein [Methylovulum sp.]